MSTARFLTAVLLGAVLAGAAFADGKDEAARETQPRGSLAAGDALGLSIFRSGLPATPAPAPAPVAKADKPPAALKR